MTEHNRYLRGDMNEILAPVHGNTIVEAGDFMFRNDVGGSIGAGVSADEYAYPFNLAKNSASPLTGIAYAIYTNFLGVATESSPSGVTEDIVIATGGIFRYPNYSLSAVTIGALVSSVSTPASNLGVSAQAVAIAGVARATTAYLGYIVKTESGASFVDLEIRTIYNGLAS